MAPTGSFPSPVAVLETHFSRASISAALLGRCSFRCLKNSASINLLRSISSTALRKYSGAATFRFKAKAMSRCPKKPGTRENQSR